MCIRLAERDPPTRATIAKARVAPATAARRRGPMGETAGARAPVGPGEEIDGGGGRVRNDPFDLGGGVMRLKSSQIGIQKFWGITQ